MPSDVTGIEDSQKSWKKHLILVATAHGDEAQRIVKDLGENGSAVMADPRTIV